MVEVSTVNFAERAIGDGGELVVNNDAQIDTKVFLIPTFPALGSILMD